MAREIHKFAVTVPAGTLQATPQKTDLTMPAREITRITVIVPPGTRGLVGFALGAAGRVFIPYEPGQFFVTDDEKIDWPLEGQITSGAWQCFAYNTGQYAHTLEFRFFAELPAGALSVGTPLLSADVLSGASSTTPETPPGAPAAPPLAGVTSSLTTPPPAPSQGGPITAPPATLATVGFRSRR